MSGAREPCFLRFIANGGVLFRQRTTPNAQIRNGIKSGRARIKKTIDAIQAFHLVQKALAPPRNRVFSQAILAQSRAISAA